MTPASRQKLKNLLVAHEAYREHVYVDSTGHYTVGIGRNLSDRGISQDEALTLLDNDIHYFTSKLSGLLSFFDSLDDNRKIALIDMCFNLGVNGFLNFHAMLNYFKEKDYEKASFEILNSKAAEQNKERYEMLAYIIKTGEL